MEKQSVSSGFAILSLGELVAKIISAIYIILLPIIIGEQGFVIYGAVYTIFTFIYVVTNSGISVAISKIVSEFIAENHYKDVKRVFKLILLFMSILGLSMSLLMYFFAEPLAVMVKFPEAYVAVKFLSPAIFFTAILSVYRGYFQGRGNMTPITISKILEQVINIIGSLLGAALLVKYGIKAGCAGATIGTSLGALVSAVYLIQIYIKNKSSMIRETESQTSSVNFSVKYLINKILTYGIPVTICIGMQYAGNVIDMSNVKGRLLAAGFDAISANDLYGNITCFNTLINIPIVVLSALSMTLLPAISKANILGQKGEIKRKIFYAFKICFTVSVPSAVGLAVLSKPIYGMIFRRMADNYKFMLFGSIIVVLWSIVLIQTTILQGIGKLYTTTMYISLGVILKVFVNYNLVSNRSINIYGALFGNIIYYIVPLILNHYLLKRTLGIKLPLTKIAFKPIVSAILMGIVIYPVQYFSNIFFTIFINVFLANVFSTILAIALGVFVFAYVLAVLQGIDNEDLQLIPLSIRKLIPKLIVKEIIHSY